MSADLPTPRARAVALAYNETDIAPRVVAKGSGLIAEEIIRRAREAGVFVHESAELVSLLARVDLDQHIPPQLYLAIAEILAWVHHLEQAAQDGMPNARAAQDGVQPFQAAPVRAAPRQLPEATSQWNRSEPSSTT